MKANDSGAAVLITMRLSHYCEKARWGLDRLGFPYREEAHAPLVHRVFTKRNRGSTVPMLVHGERSLTNSSEILAYIDAACGGGHLYPGNEALRHEVRELETGFDRQLGPQVRRWAYSHLLQERKLLRHVWSDGVSPTEALMVPVVMPLVRPMIRRVYRITADGAARSLHILDEVFAGVGARLSDGRAYLAGDSFTAADLTFASLAAPLLFPPACAAALPPLERVPPAMREQVARFRATAAGEFAMTLYQRERGLTVCRRS